MKTKTGIMWFKKGIICLCVIILGVLFCYLAGVFYFWDRFFTNTWINGMYCTGMTITEADSEFQKKETPSICIVDKNNQSIFLEASDFSLQENYIDDLTEILKTQNPFLWFQGNTGDYCVQAKFFYDREALQRILEEQFGNGSIIAAKPVIRFVKTENGFALQEKNLNVVDRDQLLRDIEERIKKGLNEKQIITLDEYYEDAKLTYKQQKIREQWEKINAFQNLKIGYDMGSETILLTPSELSEMLVLQNGLFEETDQGTLMINREKTDAYVDALADQYDTYQKERKFMTSRGDEVLISRGTYGTLLDRETEKQAFYEMVSEAKAQIRVPQYLRQPYHRGLDDIGDTYVEIDLTSQKMYFYQEGECLVSTDVVTGDVSAKRSTPDGIYAIYAKERNRILRGADYASFVYYWMPYYGGIGIHDAGWRSRFGGNIYLNNGSHGCVNTPYEKVKIIYEAVEVGVPVIAYH